MLQFTGSQRVGHDSTTTATTKPHVIWSLLVVFSALVTLNCFLTYRFLLHCPLCLEHFVPLQFFTELIPTHLFDVRLSASAFVKALIPQTGLGVLSLCSSTSVVIFYIQLYSTILKPGDGHGYNRQTSFRFHMFSFVSVVGHLCVRLSASTHLSVWA